MVQFGDLKSESGLVALNDYLLSRSYIIGFQPSQADTTTFNAVGTKPLPKFPNVLRWYTHIESYGSEKAKFPSSTGCGDIANVAPPKSNDNFDLFGSDDDDDDEDEKIKEQINNAVKSKKPAVIAKSSILFDVKPWDDETDVALIEEKVRSIKLDGLVWGASKKVPVAYGINKLQIMCVVEDDKVSVDFLEEEIAKFEDLVQSVDIAAFNKI